MTGTSSKGRLLNKRSSSFCGKKSDLYRRVSLGGNVSISQCVGTWDVWYLRECSMSLQLCFGMHQLKRWSRHPALTHETHTGTHFCLFIHMGREVRKEWLGRGRMRRWGDATLENGTKLETNIFWALPLPHTHTKPHTNKHAHTHTYTHTVVTGSWDAGLCNKVGFGLKCRPINWAVMVP